MESELAVRIMRDKLASLLKVPCDCEGPCALLCELGKQMMQGNLKVLDWVLGDRQDFAIVIAETEKEFNL